VKYNAEKTQQTHKAIMFTVTIIVAILSSIYLFNWYNKKRALRKEEKKSEKQRKAKEEQDTWNERAKQHTANVDEKTGHIICSCGVVCGTQHVHNLHVESKAHLTPMHKSGWPERQFETVPVVKYAQPGVVTKNDLPNGMFTTVRLKSGFNMDRVRTILSNISQLTDEVSQIDATARLTSVIAVHPLLWLKFQPVVSLPDHLFTFTEKKSKSGDRVLFPESTQPDIFLFTKAGRPDLPYELSKRFLNSFEEDLEDFTHVPSFGYLPVPMAARDLTGFIDGTRNPDHLLRSIVDQSLIFPGDSESSRSHQGGSYMYAGKFLHDLKIVRDMNKEDRDNLVGRDYDAVKPHVGYDKRPENPHLDAPHPCAHIRRAYASIYRQAMPFVSEKDEGLYFICFSRYLTEIDESINRMCGYYERDGKEYVDNLFKFTKSVTNGYYYVPSLPELQSLGDLSIKCSVSDETIVEQTEEMSQRSIESLERNKNKDKKIKIYIEYCVNCAYVSIFNEKKKVLESVDSNVEVIANPHFPRLSAFEVVMDDGTVLWSKLSQPDGRNNYPHVFPKNEVLVQKLKEKLGIQSTTTTESTEVDSVIEEFGTRVGVW
jgi:Dyp-type peroxidase family